MSVLLDLHGRSSESMLPAHLRAAPAILLAIGLLLGAGPSWAMSLVLDRDLRTLRAVDPDLGDFCEDVGPSAAFGAFDAYAACVHGQSTQLSTATPVELAGEGALFTTGGGFDIDVETRYAMRFYVDEATPFALDATFGFSAYRETPGSIGQSAGSGAYARLLSTDKAAHDFYELWLPFLPGSVPPAQSTEFETVFGVESDGPLRSLAGTGLVSETGVLLPGRLYWLEVGVRAEREEFVSEADTFFEMTFIVPEPGSAALLALGLAALGTLRRR